MVVVQGDFVPYFKKNKSLFFTNFKNIGLVRF